MEEYQVLGEAEGDNFMNVSGQVIYGRVINQTVTTPLEITWETKSGATRTLAENDVINIIDVFVSTAATAKDVILFQDNDGDNALDSGEEIIPPIEFAGQGNFSHVFGADVTLQPINAAGTNNLHIVASTTGTVSAFITAVITQV